MSTERDGRDIIFYCDEHPVPGEEICETYEGPGFMDALGDAKQDGWEAYTNPEIKSRGEWLHRCPDCAKKLAAIFERPETDE